MKALFLAATLLLALPCFADAYHVPEGSYSGTGTWSDNFGATGTWTMDITFTATATGYHEEFTSSMSDGRSYSGAADLTFDANSNFVYTTTVGGSPMTIGHGVSSPGAYQVTDLMLNANESIAEFGDFSQCGVWQRWGTITDKSSGRATQYKIQEFLQ